MDAIEIWGVAWFLIVTCPTIYWWLELERDKERERVAALETDNQGLMAYLPALCFTASQLMADRLERDTDQG